MVSLSNFNASLDEITGNREYRLQLINLKAKKRDAAIHNFKQKAAEAGMKPEEIELELARFELNNL